MWLFLVFWIVVKVEYVWLWIVGIFWLIELVGKFEIVVCCEVYEFRYDELFYFDVGMWVIGDVFVEVGCQGEYVDV